MKTHKLSRKKRKQMWKLIRAVDDGQDILQIPAEMYEPLAACIELGYIAGIKCARNVRGNPMFDIIKPRVTLAGAVFHDERHPNRLSWIAIVLSAIALAVSLASTFTPFGEWAKDWFDQFKPSSLTVQSTETTESPQVH